MRTKLLLFALLITAGTTQLFAHALWIQTAPTGKAGQKQSVKIIYAEPGDKPEKLSEWYSDVKEFELWLTTPDNKKTKLATVAGEDHFTSEFTPTQDGVYTLSVGHTAKELGGETVYQFNASALVTVGKASVGNDPSLNKNELSVFADPAKTYKVNSPLTLKSLFKNTSNEKLYVSIASPSGWSKQISTDEQGLADFTPIWPGTYYIEVSKSWKETGKLHGKDYKSFWRSATLLVEVAR
ncbi:DUF4198 domain-containing protein [Dyadobacter aurulentus]|uniref:DUF4198 domain-containing protein n=1 Tax=Dyadobacter sp. UC 10 TaxID=2605428 RepID=UPI0011F2FDCC|nr:DUF4198 domain-containing protein [Dyadobacter sp. UC 10]KAA0991375.1 DUF4198 domain-containing protein [Dyadobacter sp. UC 10]